MIDNIGLNIEDMKKQREFYDEEMYKIGIGNEMELGDWVG